MKNPRFLPVLEFCEQRKIRPCVVNMWFCELFIENTWFFVRKTHCFSTWIKNRFCVFWCVFIKKGDKNAHFWCFYVFYTGTNCCYESKEKSRKAGNFWLGATCLYRHENPDEFKRLSTFCEIFLHDWLTTSVLIQDSSYALTTQFFINWSI